MIGDQVVTDAELEELAKERLIRLRSEEYQIKKQVLDDHIARVLMEAEAKGRGVSLEQLQKQEIDDKVLPVTQDQKRAVYESSPPQQFAGRSELEAYAQIEANLKRIRMSEARSRFSNTLRLKRPVTILIEPPRLLIADRGRPSLGPADAPVTIVEFSDFQCPACARALPTIKRLMKQFDGKVRLVFRDFPLPMHPQAPKAAEAAACASEQGKFWDLHDHMFANQRKLGVADLKAAAAELGIDASRFGSCLDAGKHSEEVQHEISAARRYGVSATPTFFINGRMLQGVPPLQAFVGLIEEELKRSAVAVR